MRPPRLTLLSLFALVAFLALPARDARAGLGANIASIAVANVGKGACSTNSTGGTAFDSSCTGNGGQPEYWCADFARWVWAAAGVDTSTLDAAAGSFYVYGENNNTLHYPPSVGDAVVFDYSGDGIANHVAIVVQVNTDNSIVTVSGDWGGNGASEAAFSSSSSVVENTPAYASTVGSVPAIMGMTISGFISPIGGPPPCTDACTASSRIGIAAAPTGSGYWIADSAGHVYPNGNASFFGDLTGVSLAQPVVGITATPSGQGYWMVAADGGVFSFGDATFHGSQGGSPLNKPMVGMASSPTGAGYWLVAADGGTFSFGDAAFHGSAGGMTLNKPVVGMAATPTGGGYWLVAADGGIFSYGDAVFHGSAGGTTLNAPVVGMAATSTGGGYWLVAADGGIFNYGDAAFDGSAGGMTLNAPVVGMATTPGQGGYWLVGSDGGIFTYGNASYDGNALGTTCSGSTPVECVVASNGCTVTQNATACAAGQACAHGTCQTTCTDACTSGASQCSGAQIQVCGRYTSEPCNGWSPAAACPSGQTCSNGVCGSPTCTDACEPGATECQGGMLVTCSGETDGGCHGWGAPTACQYGQTCRSGGCVTTPDGGFPTPDGGSSMSDAAASGSSSSGKGSEASSGKGSGTGTSGQTGKGVGHGAGSSGSREQGVGDGGASDAGPSGSSGSSSGCATARDTSGSLWSTGVLVGLVAMALRRRRRSRPAFGLAVSALLISALGFVGCSSATSPTPGENLGTTSSALDANDQASYDFFVGKGLTSFQAAGIGGNLDQESSMNPQAVQYPSGPGRGIAQWSVGGRWDTDANDNVVWYAAQQGESEWSLNLQLEFIWYELNTFSGYGLAELRASTNVTDATVAFETYYEGCGTCDQSNRIAYAEAALAAYGSTPPPPTCTSTCTAHERVGIAATPTGEGYWVADSGGGVYPNGNAGFFGDLTGTTLAKPVVGIAATPSGQGYWLVAADGGVFGFGDAGFYGSEGGMTLNKPVVGMAVAAGGAGYWLVAADGGIFSFGSAAFHGSEGGTTLNKPVVGMAATPDGGGYWLVAADGGIFSFGNAAFHGSTGGMTLNAPVVGMSVTPTGAGYWLVASDGGIFAFGDAVFEGSAGGMSLNEPVSGMSRTADGAGYWLVAQDGGVFTYGDAPYLGNGLGSTCSGDAPQVCTLGSNGCYSLTSAMACASGQACANGTCQSTCTDACTAGASQCSGTSIEVCGRYGSTACNVWSPAAACPTGQSCSSDVCSSPTCTDACEPGASKCQNGELVACTGTTTGGCHTWGAPTACQAGQTCQSDGCVSANATKKDGGGAPADAGDGGDASSGGGGKDAGKKPPGKSDAGRGVVVDARAPTGRDGGTNAGEAGSDGEQLGSNGGCAVTGRGDRPIGSALALVALVAGRRRRTRARARERAATEPGSA